MAVHHFTAPDLTVARGWQPINTFPRDGIVVEVRDEAGNIVKAHWQDDALTIAPGLSDAPVQWRHPE